MRDKAVDYPARLSKPLLARVRFRGFSMIELLVVAAIVAAVAAMLLVVMGKVYEVIRSWN